LEEVSISGSPLSSDNTIHYSFMSS